MKKPVQSESRNLELDNAIADLFDQTLDIDRVADHYGVTIKEAFIAIQVNTRRKIATLKPVPPAPGLFLVGKRRAA